MRELPMEQQHEAIGFLVIAILIIIASALSLAAYFIPCGVAFYREHEYRWPIFVINLFFGWTAIGWVGALVWAIMPKRTF